MHIQIYVLFDIQKIFKYIPIYSIFICYFLPCGTWNRATWRQPSNQARDMHRASAKASATANPRTPTPSPQDLSAQHKNCQGVTTYVVGPWLES